MKPTVLTLFCMAATALAAPSSVKPPEQVAREFFTYLCANSLRAVGPDISADTVAQERWLSHDLRDLLHRAQRYIASHHPKRDQIPLPQPNNASFLLAWDPPDRFVVSRSLATPFTAIVSGRCYWGRQHQYAGDIRATSAILVFEDGAWRFADIQAHKGKFNSDTSLIQSLNNSTK